MDLPKKVSPIRWRGLFFITFITAFLYVFMEWLFTITRPAFLTNLGWLSKSEILLFTSGFVISFSLLAIGVIFFLAKIRPSYRYQKVFFSLAAVLPAMLLSAMCLLLVDNFTFTVFGYGIVNSQGVVRVVYALAFLGAFVAFFRNMWSWSGFTGKRILRKQKGWLIAAGLVIILSLMLVIPFTRAGSRVIPATNISGQYNPENLPNIVLITSDGLTSEHMSIYGYYRPTTPYLDQWRDEAILVENAFTNSAKTAGSIISMLTGKYPAATRLIYPPDILRGEDSYQHLPGLLHSLGYYTAQFGHYYIVDAYTQNMLRAFDEVNGQKGFKSNYVDLVDEIIPVDYAYFMYTTFNRIFDRLRHIFFILKMDDSFQQLTVPDGYFADDKKIEALNSLIQNQKQPLFIHLHWMGTHGEYFYVKNQVFSAGKDMYNQTAWDVDFFDDSILEMDETVRGIMNSLTMAGRAQNTIIVIASDHGQKWVANQRLPLLFFFPQGQYAQQIALNGQNLDIAPTILDYLGIEKPIWMQGDSLLAGLDQQRPIFSVNVGETIMGENMIIVDEEAATPPFYQFGELTMLDCDRYYSLRLREGFRLRMTHIKNYATTCQTTAKTDEEVLQLMIEHLRQNQFDTTSLEEWAAK